jgi:hypothetical protein
MHNPVEDPRLTRLSALCLALPEATRELHGDHATFLAGKKTFAYYLANHHGDGVVGVCAKALPGDNQRLIDGDPKRFYMPAYVGPRGWVGLRLDLGEIDWEEVTELVKGSYRLAAPKRLAASLQL